MKNALLEIRGAPQLSHLPIMAFGMSSADYPPFIVEKFRPDRIFIECSWAFPSRSVSVAPLTRMLTVATQGLRIPRNARLPDPRARARDI